MPVFHRESRLVVRCLCGVAIVLGVLLALGLLAPLGGWIEGQQGLLRLLGPFRLLACFIASRLPLRWLRWAVSLLCGSGVAGWLALLIVPEVSAEQQAIALGAVTVAALGVVLFVLLEREGRKADNPVAPRTSGDPRWN